MKGISINGNYLHKIMMPLEPFENCNSATFLCYPKHRIKFELSDNMLKLIVPTKLALEMYRIGVLIQNKNLVVPIAVSGKSIGHFKVTDFLYPNSYEHNDDVFITFLKQQKC